MANYDSSLNHLIQSRKIGSDGTWTGQVEARNNDPDNKGGYRYKVRVIGFHPNDLEALPTVDLPWAHVQMPVTAPFLSGNTGGAHPQLEVGCWVRGQWLDPESKQIPIIVGSIGAVPGATTQKLFATTELEGAFLTQIPPDTNPAIDGDAAESDTNDTTGALPDGELNSKKKPKVPIPSRWESNDAREKWCQTLAEKCDDQDLKSQIDGILGDFLKIVQDSGGNIGTYGASKAMGGINNLVTDARRFTNKMMRVIREFIARVKGFVIEKMTNAVKDLINAILKPDETGNALTPVTEWFNNLLKDLGCKMADLGERLEEWLTNVLMGYVQDIYRAAACQVDTLVNGILSKINALMEEILGSILGPIQDILGAIAGPLNLLGQAVNFVMQLLGISCSGPDKTCKKYKKICTDGEKKEKGDDKDFLDNLLDSIDNLFPATGADYTQYTCEDAYTGNRLVTTNIGFTGGVPSPVKNPDLTAAENKKKIFYTIDDVEVEEGREALFRVTRSGYLDSASSLRFRTLKKGTATPDVDYLSVSGILGFAPTEKEKFIAVRTLFNQPQEVAETFYVKLEINSPVDGTDIGSNFIKNIAQGTIREEDPVNIDDPYKPGDTNPVTGLDDVFPPETTDVFPDPEEGEDTTPDPSQPPRYTVTPNRTTCPEGEFIVYTIETFNVVNGTVVYYTLTGDGITSGDIVNGSLTGNVRINDGKAKVTIGIEDDGVVEEEEILRFTLNSKGAFADVLITSGSDLADDDESEEVPDPTDDIFEPPVVNPDDVITDENGGIIDIPIDTPGDPWAEPPYVFVGGEGIGAVATALLDEKGFLTEIRVQAPGYGYKLNLAKDKGVRCIIDSFTILRPGRGYKETPQMYVDGKLGVAEAIINDDGFVVGARILDRQRIFEELPDVVIVGGGGVGAKLLPSLACLDTEQLSTIGATRIGTGQYIDCP
tara:strand:+ start:180 stop:3005 length:2826 start_codon:yes stop_codon:yes gene_type:complete